MSETMIIPIDNLRVDVDTRGTNNEKEIEEITQTMKEYGALTPLIITRDNRIVFGYGRYLAALRLGIKEVPCVFEDDARAAASGVAGGNDE